MRGNSWRSSVAAEKFAALLVGSAGRSSLRFGDDEHRQNMGYADRRKCFQRSRQLYPVGYGADRS